MDFIAFFAFFIDVILIFTQPPESRVPRKEGGCKSKVEGRFFVPKRNGTRMTQMQRMKADFFLPTDFHRLKELKYK